MFEHFTFGAQPQTQHHLLDDDAFPSPTDTSFPSPLTPPRSALPFPSNPHQAGVSDIVARFSQQSLQQQQSRSQQVHHFPAWHSDTDCGPPEVDDEEDDDEDEDTDMASERITTTASLPGTPVLPPASTLACKRLQRQLNVQLQTSSSHIRDINALVDDMIVSKSQCTLRQPTARPYPYLSSPPPSRGSDAGEQLAIDTSDSDDPRPAAEDIDEGFCDGESFGLEEEAEMEFSLRRASTPSGVRKYNGASAGAKYGRSCDVVHTGGGGRCKVRSLPRMRKRKVPRVPE